VTGKREPPDESRPDPASTATRCRLFRITGRVQGVFFRDSTRERARQLGLTGSARNMPDGSVEVLACGTGEALEQLGLWLQSGPPMAVVSNVESKDVGQQQCRSFTIG
jgi:acylphosphatase